MNKAKLDIALALLEQALYEPVSHSKPPRRVTRYYCVMPTRMDYKTGNLRLQPWYGSPEHASLKVVMEVRDEGRLSDARVIEAEVIKKRC